LVDENTGAAGTGMVGAQPITVERPDDGPGPAGPGESYNFSVTPTADYPYVSMAAMVVQTNDVFLAFGPSGVALLDGEGNPRPTEMVMEDIHRMLAVWDAGTEANEVPGVGAHVKRLVTQAMQTQMRQYVSMEMLLMIWLAAVQVVLPT